MIDIAKIEQKIDHTIASTVPVDAELGGLTLENMGQVMEFAKLMSVSGAMVPEHLRGNPGACLAICSRAMRWKMDPFAVAEQSYITKTTVGYMSQLIHAVVETRAPLKGRLRHEIIGEGEDRRCKVWGTFLRETEPHVYISETLVKLREARGKNDKGGVRGSPLWVDNPEVQLAYSAVRQWARLYSPETLLGVYARDELDDEPVDVSPPSQVAALVQKLKDAKMPQQGFDPHSHTIIEGATDEAKDATDSRADGDETATHETKETNKTPDQPAQKTKAEPATRRAGNKRR